MHSNRAPSTEPSTRSERPRPTGRPSPTALASVPRRCDKDPVLRGGDGLDADLIARLYAETAGW